MKGECEMSIAAVNEQSFVVRLFRLCGGQGSSAAAAACCRTRSYAQPWMGTPRQSVSC